MAPQSVYKSVEIVSESVKARSPYVMKRFSAEGKDVPLKKNWSEEWCALPIAFEDIMSEILDFEVRKDDVYVETFMKCGTTWMQECAWVLMNNLDFEKSKRVPLFERTPFLENGGIIPGSTGPNEMCQNLPSPRLIKTHMPANLMPQQIWEKKPKIIYVARNAKDVIVSSYHFIKNMGLWQGNTLEEYLEDFLNNEVLYTPYWAHIVDFWKMRHEPYIFYVTYEEMKRDLGEVLQRLCNFLERPQLTEEELKKTIEHLSFDSMKKSKTTNLTGFLLDAVPGVKKDLQFMRRGIVGSFKDELTPEMIARIDKWSSEFLAQHGLKEEDIFGKL